MLNGHMLTVPSSTIRLLPRCLSPEQRWPGKGFSFTRPSSLPLLKIRAFTRPMKKKDVKIAVFTFGVSLPLRPTPLLCYISRLLKLKKNTQSKQRCRSSPPCSGCTHLGSPRPPSFFRDPFLLPPLCRLYILSLKGFSILCNCNSKESNAKCFISSFISLSRKLEDSQSANLTKIKNV